MTPSKLSSENRAGVESWFIKRGLPNLIHDYRASTDVFTRAAPLLVVLWFFGIAGAYGDRFTGWSQAAAAVGAAAFLLAIGAAINRFRGRRPLQMPNRVGTIELAAFVLAPALLPLVLDNGSASGFVLDVLTGCALLLLVWFTYGFGLGAILRWAIGNMIRQLGGVVGLMIRSLPLLLVFTMFLFMNAELWQVADDFTTPLFLAAAGGLVAVSTLFVLVRLPRELEDISEFTDSDDVFGSVDRSDAPLDPVPVDPAGAAPLSRTDRVNLGILAVFSLGVQVGLVMAIVGLFYLLFGVVSVRPTTITQWTEGGADSVNRLVDLRLFGEDIPITSELLKVTGFLMAFTALQFTVSALTDETYRREFFEDLTGEIREALAVRVQYLQQIER